MLQREADGWNRTGDRGILPVLDDACNLLLRTESEQTVKYNTDTGEFPSFTSEAGIFEYEAADDVWRIEEVLIPFPRTINYGIYSSPPYSGESNLVSPIEERNYGGKQYLRIQQMSVVDQLRSDPENFTPAKMLFRVDPLVCTYYYRGYKKPVTLSSENVQLPLPEHLHPYIYQATVILINGYQNGNIMEGMAIITQELRPIIQKEQNEGEQGTCNFVQVREA